MSQLSAWRGGVKGGDGGLRISEVGKEASEGREIQRGLACARAIMEVFWEEARFQFEGITWQEEGILFWGAAWGKAQKGMFRWAEAMGSG